MRLTIILLLALLPTTSARAGTWVDDFEDSNLDGWKIILNPGTAEWKAQAGKLSAKFKFPAGVNSASVISMEPRAWKDYTLEASVQLVQKLGGHMEMAFAVRVDPAIGRGYGFCLHFVDNTIQINRHRGWGAAAMQKLLTKPYQLSENTWYRVKCSIAGNHLSFYIDDGLCAEIDDAEFASGTVAIYVLNVHMLIDDIVITGDDVPDRGWAIEPRGKLVTAWASIKHR